MLLQKVVDLAKYNLNLFRKEIAARGAYSDIYGTHFDEDPQGRNCPAYLFIFFSSLVLAAYPSSLLALFKIFWLHGWAKDTSTSMFSESNNVMSGRLSLLVYWCLGSF